MAIKDLFHILSEKWHIMGGDNPEKRSFLHYAIFATAVFIIIVGFTSHDSILRWVQAGFQIRQQEKQIQIYRQQIHEMDKQIDMLSTDRDTLEQFARENFHFAESGDDVYIIEK